MREHKHWKLRTLLLCATICILLLCPARSQGASLLEAGNHSGGSAASICEETSATSPLKDALRPVCLRTPPSIADSTAGKAIIIGFVGGFAKPDDPKHPEVQFAALLRERYPSGIHAVVFSNHDGQKALRQILRFLDTDGDGTLTAIEKEQAKIIIYGHSWGASQTVMLAQELGRQGIPVRLTIQVDSIAKPGQKDSTIPPNVANAVNFYQPGGPLHGRSEVLAADPARTKIIGNFRMTYAGHPINCDNYPWYARTFNKPHHEIENDPRVWGQAASLIDSELSSSRSTDQTSSLSQSQVFK